MNTAPGAIFTTLHFLCNLWMGPISWGVTLHRVRMLTRDNHSCLLDPFVSYEEKEVIWMQLLAPYSIHFIFFVIYKWVQWASFKLHYGEKACLGQTLQLIGPFFNLGRKLSVLSTAPGTVFTTLHFLHNFWIGSIS